MHVSPRALARVSDLGSALMKQWRRPSADGARTEWVGCGVGGGSRRRDLGANWSPSRSMNLLAFSHAREDHESDPAARGRACFSSRGPARFY